MGISREGHISKMAAVGPLENDFFLGLDEKAGKYSLSRVFGIEEFKYDISFAI